MAKRFVFRLPELRTFQRPLVSACLADKDVVCVASTQIGKSFAYAAALVAACWSDGPNPPFPSWWAAPSYKQSRQGQRVMYQITSSAGIRESGPKPPFVTNPPPPLVLLNKGTIEYRTFDNPENLMGDPIRRAVVDEAGQMLPEAHSAISTRRSDTLGPLWYIGNPGRRTGPFRRIAARAQAEGRLFSFNWHDKHEWLLTVDKARADEYEAFIESERIEIPDFEFRRLYEAEWTEDEAAVFRGVHAAVVGERFAWDKADSGDELLAIPRVIGVDVGQSNDYLVAIGMQKHTGHCDVMERFRGVGYPQAAIRLKAMQDALRAPIIVEENGVGIALCQEFDRLQVNYIPFTTSNASKQEIVLALSADIENSRVTFADMEPLPYELETYQYERMPSGVYRYSAPAGEHDDTVMALALANNAKRRSSFDRVEWVA